MRSAFLLGRILGINVYIHFSFFLIFIWQAYIALQEGLGWLAILYQCLLLATMFLCVLMHEYGHALAARRFGIQTKRITLLPIGGVAQLERMPQNPKQELIVALAGPMVNIAIVSVLLPILLINYSFLDIYGTLSYFITRGSSGYLSNKLAENILFMLLTLNTILTIFNLLPAFPMDGGRVLRALLGFRLSFKQATTIAARIGQIMAIGFIIAGYYYNFFLIFIGLFVIFGAEMELRMARRKYLGFNFSVADVLQTEFTVLQANETLKEALIKILANQQEEDLLVEKDGKISGVVHRNEIIQNLHQPSDNEYIADIMQTDVASVSVIDSIDEVLQNMRLYNTSVLPVYDDEKLLGVISLSAIQAQILSLRAANN